MKIIKPILNRNAKGVKPDNLEWTLLYNEWLKIYGQGGCDCDPYLTNDDMITDLNEYYKIKGD